MSLLVRALRDADRHLDALGVTTTVADLQDADDLRALLAVADAVERRRCGDALALITARNCARERDFFAAWRGARRRVASRASLQARA